MEAIMSKFTELNLSNDDRHAITNGIFKAISQDMPDLINDEQLPTAIAAPLFRHNFIIRNVQNNLGGNFDSKIIPRGPFQVLLLFEKDIGFTFSIMSEANFERLRKRLPDNPHYIEAFVFNNTGYEEIEGQMFFEDSRPERDKMVIENLRNKIMQFDGIIKNHIVVLFSSTFNKVTSIRIVLPTPQLGIAYSEDWSSFMETPFFSKTSILNTDLINEDEEFLVKLKGTDNDPDPDGLAELPQEQLPKSE
jgi:hypothetical protein